MNLLSEGYISRCSHSFGLMFSHLKPTQSPKQWMESVSTSFIYVSQRYLGCTSVVIKTMLLWVLFRTRHPRGFKLVLVHYQSLLNFVRESKTGEIPMSHISRWCGGGGLKISKSHIHFCGGQFFLFPSPKLKKISESHICLSGGGGWGARGVSAFFYPEMLMLKSQSHIFFGRGCWLYFQFLCHPHFSVPNINFPPPPLLTQLVPIASRNIQNLCFPNTEQARCLFIYISNVSIDKTTTMPSIMGILLHWASSRLGENWTGKDSPSNTSSAFRHKYQPFSKSTSIVDFMSYQSKDKTVTCNNRVSFHFILFHRGNAMTLLIHCFACRTCRYMFVCGRQWKHVF